MYAALSLLTDLARKRETGSWFGSIHGIANHALVADLYWLRRYRALSSDSAVLNDPRLSPPGLSWQGFLHDDFADMRATRAYVDERIVDWFTEFPVGRYGEAFRYEDSRGISRHAVADRAFEFLFVHQIHHRAQVSQILDQLGIPNNYADNGVYIEAKQGEPHPS